MAEEKKQEAGAKPPRDLKFIGLLVLLIINVSVLGLAAFAIFKSTIGFQPPVILEKELQALADQRALAIQEGAEGEKALSRKPTSVDLPSFDQLMIPLDEMVTNLEGNPKRIVKAVVQLKVLDDLSYQEVLDPNRLPKVRDALLKTLQSTNFSEMESLQGKLFLKDRMLKAINPLLEEGVVRDVYFTELVAQ